MKVAKVVIFFLLFGVIGLKAQTNFVKGYYITVAHDTVRGYLEHRSNDRSFDVCVFKPTLDSKMQSFAPDAIVGFVFEDKDFYVRQVYKNKKGEEFAGFFRVIYKSDLSLLQYQSRLFAETEEGKIHEITRADVREDYTIKKDYTGLGMLKALMKGCDHVTDDLMKKNVVSVSVYKEAFRKYYACTGSTYTESQPVKVKGSFEFGVLGGPAFTSITLNNLPEGASVDRNVAYSVGAYLSVFHPRAFEHWRVLLELSYLKYKNYTYYQKGDTNNDLYISYSALRTPLLMRYSMGAFFLDAGFQGQYILAQDFRWRLENVLADRVNTEEGHLEPVEKIGLGFLAGLGAKFTVADHALRTYVRYSNVSTPSVHDNTNFKSIELTLSVQINR
ncbi:outer membrane beta-barrel protein [Chryseolinea lacunae]|uniref:Outer membrane beta-barrel protein n=1 Tax=Chryseolinea lacunae TaxID=2801331 RepID=A0ABS1KKU7_9BACT|nr:outer membrane beta-barrel protein [Chryseolinea lacunae]MBL0739858.1 outer membrane beta-barrel protein [Chryseolinea lacunae]